MRVVKIETVRERAVVQRSVGRGKGSDTMNESGFCASAPNINEIGNSGTERFSRCGKANSHRVEKTLFDTRDNLARQSVKRHIVCKLRERFDQARLGGGCHCVTTATGRTGDPVAP